jgi:hypothetical protein
MQKVRAPFRKEIVEFKEFRFEVKYIGATFFHPLLGAAWWRTIKSMMKEKPNASGKVRKTKKMSSPATPRLMMHIEDVTRS